ncbi:branched-chain amino acid ABC transporter ATP-binding protein [Prosthecomicrobium hirschii]|uniref:Branched-chain amino acid ABC transporter ATP-binding protein n=1 Tax=Prosthecodimorpha hirschii TaxID=665126 RepID=A0A0P6WIQ1_9HYPH|nr:ABC transporter ATP-binding protein [Prosthecomicrobium hirschii]KPL54662.1 branched-chain amino acid ABC transporter ATP-binding protein [Prosthecomicrobium hirschii]
MPKLLEVRGLVRRFGGLTAVDGIDLDVAEGEMVSVIGPNGAGKTTLFNLVTGLDHPDDGSVRLAGEDVTGLAPEALARRRVARTFQHGRVFGNLTVMDNVLIGAHTRLKVARPGWPILGAVAELGRALFGVFEPAVEEYALKAEAREILKLFGDRLLPRQDQPAYSLSYANRRRVEIARALALKPRILFLDEPTAGMNPTETNEIMEIVRGLKATGLTIVLIEHKLDMVMRLSDRIVVMDDGARIAEGPPSAVRHDPKVIAAYLGHGSVGGADDRAAGAVAEPRLKAVAGGRA